MLNLLAGRALDALIATNTLNLPEAAYSTEWSAAGHLGRAVEHGPYGLHLSLYRTPREWKAEFLDGDYIWRGGGGVPRRSPPRWGGAWRPPSSGRLK